jgi:TetR/AcrR family transcriptional regulator, transcriptional repressor for nem operon
MDAKNRILKAGARIVLEKGFCDTGLAEVLAAAGVPKGSFYFHFKNKEDFGLQLIDSFAEVLQSSQEKFYRDENLPHLERIRILFRWQTELFRKNNFIGGCPIGNLSLEMGDRNPAFRKKLNRVFLEMKKNLTAQLEQARKKGEVSDSIDPEETAGFILTSYQGALVQMKVAKSTVPHEIFDRMIFERLIPKT